MTRSRAILPVLAALLLPACGYVGDPLPPSLNMAKPVTNLQVIQYGDRLLVDFTIPELTTDGVALKRPEAVELRIGAGGSPFDTNRWADSGKAIRLAAEGPGRVHGDVAAAEWTAKEVVAGVRVINAKGRASDWSNLVTVDVVVPVPTPEKLVAASDPKGARLSWSSPERSFRVFRQGPGEKQPNLVATVETAAYVDAVAAYGTEYRYIVQAIRARAESRVSEPVTIKPADEFPPAPPAGLTTVSGVGVIELMWDRNTESDLRGYNVYRALEGGSMERIANLIETPAYSDKAVETGRKYSYAVSAADQTGNESPRSAAVEVTAP
jgi:hypothetical protein